MNYIKIIKTTFLVSLILSVFIDSAQTYAKSKTSKSGNASYYDQARKLYFKKQYNLSLFYLFAYLNKLKTVPKKQQKFTEKILSKTGSFPLYMYQDSFLKKLNIPTVSIHLAKKNFQLKRYSNANFYAKRVPAENTYTAESFMIQGSIANLKNRNDGDVLFKKCIDAASKMEKIVQNRKFSRYFVLQRETCEVNIARNLYARGKFKQAIEQYDQIDKRSYTWPYILLEKAWAHYQLENYNRSLGLLMTYKNPLLEDYFFPEAEVLKSLSYYRLCLFKDSNTLIKKYYDVYHKQANQIKRVIAEGKSNPEYYFKLLISKDSKQPQAIKSLLNQMKKKLKINLHLASYFNALEEKNKIKTNRDYDFVDKKFIDFTLQKMKRVISNHVKEYFVYFVNQMNYFSFEMFNIRLEILSDKRNLIYENKKLISNRARGDLSHVNADDDEFFFDFRGEFWADEIGDYSFGLKSNCKKVEKKT